ncbi:MFS transporter [Pseudoclavibacter sp. RFBG4]|uniref:pseudouridine synthase n=1 Tax=Pseudoclavibacter sp. RFBG4 TaxID=2080575 RepID=UPI000CE85256|nr:MFS transporter [Pseudoclavibacter sp. RFBG4]
MDDFADIPLPGRDVAPVEERNDGVRLQKALAAAGVASRRVCEQYITQGRIEVNGVVVTELGSRVFPDRDEVAVDGTPIQLDPSKRYVLLNKPTGVVSTMRDEQGRPDLREFTSEFEERVYNVGRLDIDTSGLLILTNDGELAHVLAHPSFGVEKTYIARVEGRVSAKSLQRLRQGFELEDGFIKADSARLLADQPSHTASLVEIVLHSGRNRIVRRMLEEVGHPVSALVRRSFGPLNLGTLREGEMREFTTLELGRILKLARRAGEQRESGAPAQSAAPERGARQGRTARQTPSAKSKGRR